MNALLLSSIIIVGIAILFLGVRVFFFKGRFPSSHVGASKELRDQGIGCHRSQHREAQKHRNLADRIKDQEG